MLILGILSNVCEKSVFLMSLEVLMSMRIGGAAIYAEQIDSS
jgi:hypothetical protein